MKKLLLLVVMLTVLTACVNRTNRPGANPQPDADASIAMEPDKGWLSESAEYLKPSQSQSDTLQALVDVSNALQMLHNAMSDFERWVRFGRDVKGVALKNKYQLISDARLRNAVQSYLLRIDRLVDTKLDDEEARYMVYLDADEAYFELDSLLVTDYNVTHFAQLDTAAFEKLLDPKRVLPDYEQIEKEYGAGNEQLASRLKARFKSAKNIDERCVLAIALAHVSDEEDDEGLHIAVPCLLECMLADEYSVYLRDVWRTWRTLVQFANGASKDSDLFNQCFNRARMRCLATIYKAIEQHVEPVSLAINDFLMMSADENIFRYGAYGLGNQNIVEYYTIFPERYPSGDGDE